MHTFLGVVGRLSLSWQPLRGESREAVVNFDKHGDKDSGKIHLYILAILTGKYACYKYPFTLFQCGGETCDKYLFTLFQRGRETVMISICSRCSNVARKCNAVLCNPCTPFLAWWENKFSAEVSHDTYHARLSWRGGKA